MQLRVIHGGRAPKPSAEAVAADKEQRGIHLLAQRAARAMDELILGLRVAGRRHEAEALMLLRDVWVRRSVEIVESGR